MQMNRYSVKNILKNVNEYIKKSYIRQDFYTTTSKLILSSAAATTAIFAAAPAYAAVENINVGVNEYYRFNAKGNVTRIAVGNPEIADVTLLPNTNNEFLIIGKKAGSTSLLIWRGAVMDEYHIAVGVNDAGMAASIQQMIGLPYVSVRVTNNNNKIRVLLEGKVRDQIEHDRAVKIASLYTGDKGADPKRRGSDDKGFEYDVAYMPNRSYENVIDLLTIESPTQIRIEAQIIEVSATDGDKWGLTFGSPSSVTVDKDSGFTTVTLGNENTFYGGESFGGNHDTGFWLIDHFTQVNATIQALMKKGKAKILSRPNISTMSGSKAKIHIGGEIPYPKSDGNNNISYEWKNYGIRLNIDPTVAEDDSVTAEIHAEVSTPDYDRAVTTTAGTMPALRSRNVHSLVHIDAGKTMVIGGLLSTDDAKIVKKIPLISSIPIIGEFFKHHTNDSEKRELLILLTPRIVTQDDPAQMSDKMTEWYAQGQYEADQRNLVDVNNPPLPKEVEEKLEKEEKEQKENEAAENAGNPGTRMYERWQQETAEENTEASGNYDRFANVTTP